MLFEIAYLDGGRCAPNVSSETKREWVENEIVYAYN